MEPEKPLRLDKGPGDFQGPETRVPRPDYAAHESQLKDLEAEIARNKVALVRLQAKIDSHTNSDHRVSKTLVDELTRQKKLWHDERCQSEALFALYKNELAALAEEVRGLRSKIRTGTEAELDAKIDQLRRRQEHTTMSLKEEKSILTEIRDLELSRPFLLSYLSKTHNIAFKESQNAAIREHIQSLWDKIKATNVQIEEEREKMRKSKVVLQTEMPQLISQRDGLRHLLDSLELQRKSLKSAFSSQVNAYKSQAKILKFVQLIEKRFRAQGENEGHFEERKIDPNEDLKQKIDFTIAWLYRAMQRQREMEGKRGGENERTKKAKKNRRRKKQEEVAMSLEMVVFLTEIRIRTPSTTGEIPATIEALRQYRANVETEPLLSPGPPETSTQTSSKASPHEDEERRSGGRGRGRWASRKQ